MKSMNDFLRIKRQLENEGFSKKEIIDFFEKTHLKYMKLIDDCELNSKEMQNMKMERFLCFCTLMSLKSNVSYQTYEKTDQISLAA